MSTSARTFDPTLVNADRFFALARERESIRRRRLAGQTPWTKDPIFGRWFFCNVHREQDKTTAWFRDHVRSKLDGWRAVEATIAFRCFNLIATGEIVEDLLLDGWNRGEAARRLKPLYDAGQQLWTGAYRLRGEEGRSKLDTYLDVIEIARRRLPAQAERWGRSLREAWLDVQDVHLLGPLTSYEVVSDLRWTPVLGRANDINTWASIGAGCANGITWVAKGHLGDYDSSPGEVPWMDVPMRTLLAMSRDEQFWPYRDAPWEMREVEHFLCESAKYVKAEMGGTLKRRYTPSKEREQDLFASLLA